MERLANYFCLSVTETISHPAYLKFWSKSGKMRTSGLLPAGYLMNIGLMIYGTLDTISGGYLYDRMIVEHLRKLGNKVEIISLPWRNYFSHLADNFSYALCDEIRRRGLDILLQDELNHPSLLLINRRLQRDAKCSIISIVHHLRGSEAHPALLQKLYRLVENNTSTRQMASFSTVTPRARRFMRACADCAPQLSRIRM